MYYHLFDADWGSNALSWQWVCGCNSNKKYYANQHNINKFTKTKQTNTFLDLSYEELINTDLSATFLEDININLKVSFPKSEEFYNHQGKSICIYNFYNLDPKWRREIDAYRILLIEPSIFKKYPISSQSMNFMIELSKNIPNIKIIVSEFNELPIQKSKVYFKEHPLNYNYTGIEDPRDWICKPQQNFKSFFKHWKYVSKTLLSFSK